MKSPERIATIVAAFVSGAALTASFHQWTQTKTVVVTQKTERVTVVKVPEYRKMPVRKVVHHKRVTKVVKPVIIRPYVPAKAAPVPVKKKVAAPTTAPSSPWSKDSAEKEPTEKPDPPAPPVQPTTTTIIPPDPPNQP